LSKKFSPEHCFEFLDYLFGFDSTNEKVEKMAAVILHGLQDRKEPLIRNLSLSLLLTAGKCTSVGSSLGLYKHVNNLQKLTILKSLRINPLTPFDYLKAKNFSGAKTAQK
jgi:hypothetical protein